MITGFLIQADDNVCNGKLCPNVNQRASFAAWQAEVTRRLQAKYPAAEIVWHVVSAQAGYSAYVMAVTAHPGNPLADLAADEAEAEAVAVLDAVWNDGAFWVRR